MAETPEQFSPGMPVEIGRIDRELKKLWEQSSGAKTRASLMNLAVYSEAPGSLSKNTALISKLTENHACRAIVIAANPAAKVNRVEAWISAHCHVSRAGSTQICSEQLSFLLEGPSANLLPNIVFAQLDSDLPFYLWWHGEFHDPMDSQLWAWVNRLVYDSLTWSDFSTQLRLVQSAQIDARHRIVLCDLNWTRIVHHRLALAQFFDHATAHQRLAKITRVEIDHAPEYRSTALFLAGWLAAQLHWEPGTGSNNEALKFRSGGPSGVAVEVRLTKTAGQPVGRCVLTAGDLEFRVVHLPNSDLLEVACGAPGEERTHQLLPAGESDLAGLMGEELMRGGPHRVYLRAVEQVRDRM
jgi:glucose-6-phosphate dehydrogenase assembly protein OpcA